MLRFVHEEPAVGGPMTRRDWLHLGSLALLGGLTGRGEAAEPGFGRAKSVLLVYASGGQSQLDTWDPKPDAPEEVRGAFRAIPTAVPGVRFCEHMPRLAKMADRFALLRSVTHDDLDHGSASYLALTGRFHARKSANPPAQPTDFPTYGAVLHRVRPARHLPYSAVHVNGPAQVPELVAPGQFAGFLGRGCEPLLLGDVRDGAGAVPGLEAQPELPPVRLSARRSLLESLEKCRAEIEQRPALLDKDVLYRRAYEMLASPLYRKAFDLEREPRAVRERYGMHRSGQACLLARRLLEIGVPWVTVIWNHCNRGQDRYPDQTEWYGWDTHNDIFEALKVHLLPRFDATFATLLDDLQQRGLLDQTLVLCMGEFGRAPRVALEPNFAGASPGRKHWAACYSVVMAGAGVRGGLVHGSSDRHGAYPQSDPVTPGDLTATLFAGLGIDPESHFTDPAGRIFPIAMGKPIRGLYG